MLLLAAALDPIGRAYRAARQSCRVQDSRRQEYGAADAGLAWSAAGEQTGNMGYFLRKAKAERPRVKAPIIAIRYLGITEWKR
jgi:hypothetical protein